MDFLVLLEFSTNKGLFHEYFILHINFNSENKNFQFKLQENSNITDFPKTKSPIIPFNSHLNLIVSSITDPIH